MPLIRQEVKKNFRSNDAVMNGADVAILMALMEGKVSVFEERSAGGVDIATPTELRMMKFGVNRKSDGLSCTVTLKHVKVGKSSVDVFAHKALFNADYVSVAPATGISQIYQGARA